MAVIGERQVTGRNGRESFKHRRVDIFWIWEVFGPVISFGYGQVGAGLTAYQGIIPVNHRGILTSVSGKAAHGYGDLQNNTPRSTVT
jgi:hypothetical protein